MRCLPAPNDLPKGAFVVFGNRTISLHILRGVLAAAAIYGSLATMSRTIWPSIILLPAAVYLMKGWPMCWTMGLMETIVTFVHRRKERKRTSWSISGFWNAQCSHANLSNF